MGLYDENIMSRIHRDAATTTQEERNNRGELSYTNIYKRLSQIQEIIEAVDQRASAADGPVADTREEMTKAEMRKIYRLAKGGR